MDDKRPWDGEARPVASVPTTRRRRGFHWLALTALGALALTYRHAFYTRSSPAARTGTGCGMSAEEDPARVWEKIVPSAKLSWTLCYGNKECAKLSVPLDYADPSGPQAAVALLKVPSKIPRGQQGYRGPILFNPGGPGGSGVQYVLGRGEQFRAILGEDYDLIGFDPRGIGFTQPKMEVFTDPAEKASWDLRAENPAPLNATSDALPRQVARSALFGDLAKKRLSYTGQYVSTALVSRDMLRITEAHGAEKLQYWGFSYGSVLGITFAAMFPDKVERLIVDGVCDTYDYYETQWSNNLRDTDAGLRLFYEACAEAGPEACALHHSTANKVQERTEKIFAALKDRPIAVLAPANSTSQEYGLVDYGMARQVVFQYLYGPYGSRGMNASTAAAALAATEVRNGRPLLDLAKSLRAEFKCECGKDGARQDLSGRESTFAIACSDGDDVEDSVEELHAHYEKMAKFSSFAELWSVRVQCSGWKIRAKERFTGPFVGNTSFPIMLIGNTADPVTPLWNARKMARGFKDAAVLSQKSAGHSSLSAASLCTAKAIRDYFRHGVLPEQGKECDIESRMFGNPVQTLSLSEEDQKLRDAIVELSRDFEPPMLHL